MSLWSLCALPFWLRREYVAEFGVDHVEVKCRGIKVFVQPFKRFIPLRMLGIGEDFQQVHVAERPAAVIGWTGVRAFDAYGNACVGAFDLALKLQINLPVVAEVIAVIEGAPILQGFENN